MTDNSEALLWQIITLSDYFHFMEKCQKSWCQWGQLRYNSSKEKEKKHAILIKKLNVHTKVSLHRISTSQSQGDGNQLHQYGAPESFMKKEEILFEYIFFIQQTGLFSAVILNDAFICNCTSFWVMKKKIIKQSTNSHVKVCSIHRCTFTNSTNRSSLSF